MRSVAALTGSALTGGACLLLVASAMAHGDHPHPPGEPTEHAIDEVPPPAPLRDEGTHGGDKAKTTASPRPDPHDATAHPHSATPNSSPGGVGSDEGWRPKTLPDTSWRQKVREGQGGDDDGFTDFGHFYFELRFGLYSPDLDGDPAASTAYEKYFGSDPLFYFGLELDWLPVYIPYVGSLGPGFGWGFASASGKTKVQGTDTEAGSDTGLTLFPMHLSAVFRADGILRELHVPVVPYIKGGFGFVNWSASGPNADVAAKSPEGTSTGLHLAVGGALALNAFDRSAAMAMHQATGIRYANIWAEWMFDDLGGSASQLPIATSTVVFGLALDF